MDRPRGHGAAVAGPLPEAPHLDASVAYVAARSPISDPYTRYLQAEKMKRHEMIRNTKTYWVPWETIYEGNPQQILDRILPESRNSMLSAPGGDEGGLIGARLNPFKRRTDAPVAWWSGFVEADTRERDR